MFKPTVLSRNQKIGKVWDYDGYELVGIWFLNIQKGKRNKGKYENKREMNRWVKLLIAKYQPVSEGRSKSLARKLSTRKCRVKLSTVQRRSTYLEGPCDRENVGAFRRWSEENFAGSFAFSAQPMIKIRWHDKFVSFFKNSFWDFTLFTWPLIYCFPSLLLLLLIVPCIVFRFVVSDMDYTD